MYPGQRLALPGTLELDEFPDRHVVCQDGGQARSWAEFRQLIMAWQTRLVSLEQSSVALHHSNTFDFLVLLLASWRAGKRVIVPPNTLDVSCQHLSALTTAWLGEFDADKYRQYLLEPPPLAETIAEPLAGPVAVASLPDDCALQLFTSGSSGTPRLINKTFAQLHNECAMLQAVWGGELQGCLSVASVTHHHMYGLMFHPFLPFLGGRAIYSRELPYLEQLPDIAARQALVLFSSPAQLSRIPASIDWAQCRPNIKAVFTAGAPLPETAAATVEQAMGVPPTEIYGSTETGALATRQQMKDENWQCLPGVRCSADEHNMLRVQSPALPGEQWLEVGDRVRLQAEDRFELLGRADRIVKVAGKRVSLAAIEAELRKHGWIMQVQALPHHSRQDRICAVLQPSPTGAAALIDRGVLAVQNELKRSLMAHIEAVAIPRYWRFVHEMPRNSLGKTSQADLQALFHKREKVLHPDVLANDLDQAAARLHRQIRIPANLDYLEDHFPGQPVLPGVVQIAWAQQLGAQFLGVDGEFTGLEAVKFQRVIVPDDVVELQLRYDATAMKLHFSYSAGERVYSRGRLVYRAV